MFPSVVVPVIVVSVSATEFTIGHAAFLNGTPEEGDCPSIINSPRESVSPVVSSVPPKSETPLLPVALLGLIDVNVTILIGVVDVNSETEPFKDTKSAKGT